MIQQIGKHRVRHGNVMDGIAELMQGEIADMMYSDPPWGEGNLKYWCTMNKKMTGQVVQATTLDAFLDQIFRIAVTHVKGMVLIEYGIRWKEYILGKASKFGLEYIDTVQTLYNGGKKILPLHLHFFSHESTTLPDGYLDSIRDTQAYNTVRLAFKPYASPGKSVLDPCCGMGYTAQAAVDNNMRFFGNELNAKRLSKTIARLEG